MIKVNSPPTPQPPHSSLSAPVLPSKMGVASSTCCSIQECCPLMAARNCRISFVLSVFPAPDSPLQRRRKQSRDLLQLLPHSNQLPTCKTG